MMIEVFIIAWIIFSLWVGVWVFQRADGRGFVRFFYAVMNVVGVLIAGVAIFYVGCALIIHTIGF